MRYQLQQKFWSLKDDFTIRDEDGADRFRIQGSFLSFGDRLSFQDMAGRELLQINQRLLSWGPTYEIEHAGDLVATVRKHLFTVFACKFAVDVPGPDDLEASGSFLEHEYRFTRHGQPVAQVSKTWFSWSDTYGVEIAPHENEELILAAVVVIDLCCHGADD